MDRSLAPILRHALVADRVAGCPDGRWVAIEADAILTVVDRNEPTPVPDPPANRVGSVRFSADGTLLLAAPCRFDLATRSWLPDPTPVTEPGWSTATAAFSDDGSVLGWVDRQASGAQRVRWRETHAGGEVVELRHTDHWAAIGCLALAGTGDDTTIAAASTFVELWRLGSRASIWHTEPARWKITRLARCDDGVLTGDASGSVTMLDATEGSTRWSVELDGPVSGLAIVEGAVLVALEGGSVIVLDDGVEVDRAELDPVGDLASIGGSRLVAAHAPPAIGVTELDLAR